MGRPLVLEDFIAYREAQGYSRSTLTLSRYWLSHFLERYPGPPRKLKPRDLTRYHKILSWEPGPSGRLYSENTVNLAVGVIKAYFRWCIEVGELEQCPASHIVTRRPPLPERVALTFEQVRKLFACTDPETWRGLRDRAILGMVIEVQANPATLARLNVDDFQADTGALLLKSRKRRIVCLGDGLHSDLERYIRLGRQGNVFPGEQALFINHHGKRMTPGGFSVILRTHCQRAGVPKPSFSS